MKLLRHIVLVSIFDLMPVPCNSLSEEENLENRVSSLDSIEGSFHKPKSVFLSLLSSPHFQASALFTQRTIDLLWQMVFSKADCQNSILCALLEPGCLLVKRGKLFPIHSNLCGCVTCWWLHGTSKASLLKHSLCTWSPEPPCWKSYYPQAAKLRGRGARWKRRPHPRAWVGNPRLLFLSVQGAATWVTKLSSQHSAINSPAAPVAFNSWDLRHRDTSIRCPFCTISVFLIHRIHEYFTWLFLAAVFEGNWLCRNSNWNNSCVPSKSIYRNPTPKLMVLGSGPFGVITSWEKNLYIKWFVPL